MTFMKRFLTTILIILLATAPAIDNKNCFAYKKDASREGCFFHNIETMTYGTHNIMANRTEESLFVTELPPTPERPLYPEDYNIIKLNH